MKILLVTPAPPDRADRDGMTQIAFFLLRELGRDHQITLWTLAEKNDPIAEPIAGVNDFRKFNKPAANLIGHYLSFSRQPFFSARHNQPELHRALQELKPGTFDLVILHTPFMAHYLPDITGTPVVINVIDALSVWFSQDAALATNPLKKIHLAIEARRALALERRLYPRARGLSVVSDQDAAAIRHSAPGGQIAVFPIGIDDRIFFPATNKREPTTIVFTGIMNYPPNVDAAVWFVNQVWPAIHAKYPTAKFRVVGKNPAPAVSALVNVPGVVVTGLVPSVAEELRRATIAVSPLRFGTGFKIKINEALACGTPLITSTISLAGTGAQPDHDCLVADQATDWIAQIDRLLAAPKQREQLAVNAAADVAGRRWPVIAARYNAWYNSLVHETK
jgi:glycosyltransferase involved in cell wall biosynthesis